jgi:hypothetical protein
MRFEENNSREPTALNGLSAEIFSSACVAGESAVRNLHVPVASD